MGERVKSVKMSPYSKIFHERLNPQLEHYYSAIIYAVINNFLRYSYTP